MDNLLASEVIREICFYGSGRSGKTFLTCDYALERAIAYPGSAHLFIRATMNALTGGVVSQTFPNLFKAYEKHHGVNLIQARASNGQPFIYHRAAPYNEFILFNNSRIRFTGLDVQSTNATALDKILSQEYMTIIFEEGTEIDFEVVEMAKSRLAQKCYHMSRTNADGSPYEGIPKWICTLNPRTFEDWDYVYFQEGLHPIDKEKKLPHPERRAICHFHIDDNIENVSATYLDTLDSMSTASQQRFKAGMHGDSFEGDVFKKINWETLPPIHEFTQLITYTDPSYKSGPKNDYKASILLGKHISGAYWIINGRAHQCTTSHMITNVYALNQWAIGWGWHKPLVNWFENAGMPDDFEDAIKLHAASTGWACPYKYDNREKGDKYARIESVLEPLSRDGLLFFNAAIKKERFGGLCSIQFLNFKRKLLPTEHDDVPDAVHGGVTLINMPVIKPGEVRVSDNRSNSRIG